MPDETILNFYRNNAAAALAPAASRSGAQQLPQPYVHQPVELLQPVLEFPNGDSRLPRLRRMPDREETI